MEKHVFLFLKKNLDSSRPLLVGLSGGPDSLALLYLLKKYPHLKLGIAHVDHGWRKESEVEAQQLKELAHQLTIPFHLKKINKEALEGNLEDACRTIRLHFFKNLCEEFNYQAVVLGHHYDDQVETVLKRVLEGASLSSLSGISSKVSINGLVVWRPLLNVSKEQILLWLEKNRLPFFEDSTNTDCRFLRARLRAKVLPQLAKEFGKEIKHSLFRMGSEAAELKEYLDYRVQPYLERISCAKIGSFIDLSHQDISSKSIVHSEQATHPTEALHPLELKYLLKRFCNKHGFPLSQDSKQKVTPLFFSNAANKKFVSRQYNLWLDRKRLFILNFSFEKTFSQSLNIPTILLQEGLQKGIFDYGVWEIQVETSSYFSHQVDWKSLWQEEFSIWLPKKEYVIGHVKLSSTYTKKGTIGDWWTVHKVPAFLRFVLPVIWEKETIVYELLSGHSTVDQAKLDFESREGFKISFRFNRDFTSGNVAI